MTIAEWAGFILSVLSIIAAVAAGVRWLVKQYLAELRPNGGGSIKDQVNRLEAKVSEAESIRKEMSAKLDKMYDILLEHVSKSSR